MQTILRCSESIQLKLKETSADEALPDSFENLLCSNYWLLVNHSLHFIFASYKVRYRLEHLLALVAKVEMETR
jgi:hypothetical protein